MWRNKVFHTVFTVILCGLLFPLSCFTMTEDEEDWKVKGAIRAINDSCDQTKIFGMIRLMELGYDGALDLLRPYLEDENPELMQTALVVLAQYGSENLPSLLPVVEKLLLYKNDALRSADERKVRIAALVAVASIGPEAAKLYPVIVQALQSTKRDDEITAALHALSSLGDNLPPSAASYAGAFLDPGRRGRAALIAALKLVEQTGENDVELVSKVETLLSHKSSKVVKQALRTLRRLGESSLDPQQVIEMLADRHLRKEAERTIAVVSFANADLDEIAWKSLSSTEYKERVTGCKILSLRKQQEISTEKLSSLTRLLADEHWQCRKAAILALANIFHDSEKIQKSVWQLVGDENWAVQQAVFSFPGILKGRLDDPEVISLLKEKIEGQRKSPVEYTMMMQAVRDALEEDTKLPFSFVLALCRKGSYKFSQTLSVIGNLAGSAEYPFWDTLKDPEVVGSDEILQTLPFFTTASANIIEEAALFLKSDDAEEKILALKVLARMGGAASGKVPEILPILQETAHPYLVDQALYTLKYINTTPPSKLGVALYSLEVKGYERAELYAAMWDMSRNEAFKRLKNRQNRGIFTDSGIEEKLKVERLLNLHDEGITQSLFDHKVVDNEYNIVVPAHPRLYAPAVQKQAMLVLLPYIKQFALGKERNDTSLFSRDVLRALIPLSASITKADADYIAEHTLIADVDDLSAFVSLLAKVNKPSPLQYDALAGSLRRYVTRDIHNVLQQLQDLNGANENLIYALDQVAQVKKGVIRDLAIKKTRDSGEPAVSDRSANIIEAALLSYVSRGYPGVFFEMGKVGDRKHYQVVDYLEENGPFSQAQFNKLLPDFCKPIPASTKFMNRRQEVVVYGAIRYMVLAHIDDAGFENLESTCRKMQNDSVSFFSRPPAKHNFMGMSKM